MDWNGESPASERYHPATGAWSPADAGLNHQPRSLATRLADGQVLVTGGELHSACRLYDPATGTWKTAAPLPHPRAFHTATTLADGTVLVAGGKNTAGEGHQDLSAVDTCLLYHSATGTWSPAPSLRDPRRQHTATLLPNGTVLLVGGTDATDSPTASIEVYAPSPRPPAH